ncbi:MAG: TonB-dependent receptor [Gemmatimonadetes bacterium]|nr:TonB-dependent receptor [Gemmatimonadota bacterium]
MKRSHILTLCLMLLPTSVLALQIHGKVSDAATGDALVGATVVVEGTRLGAVTDLSGSYSIEGLQAGQHTVVASYIGYDSESQAVTVTESGATADFSLTNSPVAIESVTIVGSRFRPRTQITSAVPIDNLQARELISTGQVSLDHMLAYKVPSYNVSQQTISDATAHFDPAELRGLGPSRTLVLINGKRRHASSLVYINDTPGKGEVGVDMRSIPTAAIERVEVLRDGASAQYGSDAIAGVVNIIMKEETDYTEINLSAGQTAGGHRNAGDGDNKSVDINHGMNLGEKGYLSVTASYHDQDETRRTGEPGGDGLFGFLYDIGAIPIQAAGGFEATPGVVATGAQIRSGDTDWQRENPDLGTRIGTPNMTTADVFLNGSYDLNEQTELYAFTGFTQREGLSYALYRAPYWPGVSDCCGLIPGASANGFQPTFETDITDNSFTAGVRGRKMDWDFDASLSSGRNTVDYTVDNSLNMDLGADSPTTFEPGGYEFGHAVVNLDVANTFDQLSLGLGTEIRIENFVATTGDEASYTGGGAQSSPGIQPQNAVDEDRSNVGFYADAGYDLNDDVLIGLAARFENYSDFGTSVTWGANGRYKMLDDNFSVRSSLSTGFRAPSLHQIYLSNVQTLLSAGTISNQGTYNNESEIVRSLGVGELKQETSTNFMLGVAFKPRPGWYASVDYYNIAVDDRIVYSSSIASSDETTQVFQILSDANITSLKFFSNAVDTKTTGVDIVVDIPGLELGPGGLDINVAANISSTEIVGAIATPGPIAAAGGTLFDRKEQSRIETARPSEKIALALTYRVGNLSAALNNTRFGEVTWRHAGGDATKDYDDTTDQTFAAKVLTDLILNYRVNEMFGINLAVNNLLDVYPDKLDSKGDFEADLGGRFEYPWEVNQFGFTGMTIRSGLSVRF